MLERKNKASSSYAAETKSFTSRKYYSRSKRDESLEGPQLIMYQLLRSILRNQIRKPFQLIRQMLPIQQPEESFDIGNKHTLYELEVAGANILNVAGSIQRRVQRDAFKTIHNIYQCKLRVYCNLQNLTRLNISMTFTQNIKKIYLKWQGFSSLYQHYKGTKLSKLNLSKIDMINNDNTQYQEFNHFLAERGREIEAINSYIIDNSIEEEAQHEIEEKTTGSPLVGTNFKGRMTSQKRTGKKSSTAYHDLKEVRESEQLEQKVLITHRKEMERNSAGSTQKQIINSPNENHHVFLIRDYCIKEDAPTNYIKVPVATESLKIVEIQTGRKKTKKQRIVKSEFQIQKQICSNCKFCQQKRERRETLQRLERREVSFRGQ